MSPPKQLVAALQHAYRIERELGAGGMATVYLAEDLKHDRKVAIKVLKPELAAVLGAERFVVEIKTTAAMSHPHILPLFDSGTADGFLFYVMPYIQGETIREKLNRETQFGVDEAIRIAREVADALDYAHRHGVIHRDIKPENILLHDGRAMVMDFGIALAVSAAAGGRMTETGLSLGTPHYMSPEQATAEKEITARSDVYSLASVLYEMLAGQPPHIGGAAQQVIMKIITEPAQPVRQHRKNVPPNVDAALTQALEKLPADRFESAKAFAEALASPVFGATDGVRGLVGAGRTTGWRGWLRDPRSISTLGVIAVLAAVAALAARRGPAGAAPAGTWRLSVVGPPDSGIVAMNHSRGGANTTLAGPAVSPDGAHLLFTITRAKGATLMLRALNRPELHTVADSGVNGAFFSHNGAQLGYFIGSDLWTTSLTELKPARIARVPESDWNIYSAAWHPDGRILVVGSRGIWAIPTKGGEATMLVPNNGGAENAIHAVQVLQDGRVLITRRPGQSLAEVRSADGTDSTTAFPGLDVVSVIEDIAFHLQAGGLRASRVDLRSLSAIGDPISLDDVPVRLGRSIAAYDTSTLLLQPVYRNANGTDSALPVSPVNFIRWPRLSPDGRRLALGTLNGLEVVDLDRRARWRISGSTEPVFTPDGSRVITSLGDRPHGGMVIQVADGSRPADTLLTLSSGDAFPTSVSSDGSWLAYYGQSDEASGSAETDVYFMKLGDRTTRRFSLPAPQFGARFSPNQRWVAYQSVEDGRDQVYVTDWPALSARHLISTDGGRVPLWSSDGRTIYYRRRADVLAVTIEESKGAVVVSAPRVVFSGPYRFDPSGDQDYDLAPDGRFVMVKSRGGDRIVIDVTLNWLDDVRAQLERTR